MNKLNQILVAMLVIQISLGVYTFWPSTTVAEAGAPLLADFSVDNVTGLTISDGEGNEISLAKNETGWVLPQAEPLTPERGRNDWWSAELTLTDGMAKFVANENYGTSWGVQYSWDVIDPLAHETFYLGDPDAVFPAGIGVLDGQNIPIRAGRYRVRFNVHTYEYAFEELRNAR